MMSITDTIQIELSNVERYVLTDLLESFIHERVTGVVESAGDSLELERAAERVKRLAEARDAAWKGTLPRATLNDHLVDFMAWLSEAEQTAEDSQKCIAEEAEDQRRSGVERDKTIKGLRDSIVTDYAHKTVCERVVAQIQAAQGVTA